MLPKINSTVISSMSEDSISKVRELETEALKYEQAHIETTHNFHAGMYARTIMIPEGVMLTGALIKIPTILILNGDGIIYTDEGSKEYHGHNVWNAEANRKQAFIAITNTYLTMIFPTKSITIEEAESEFTDEVGLLLTNREV